MKSHPKFSLRAAARRCENEFNILFKMRFEQKFGDGLKISPNRHGLQLNYFPISAPHWGYYSIRLNLPDVSRLRAPVQTLMRLAHSCTNELESFSRFICKQEDSNNLLAAIALLPNDLVTSIFHRQCQRFKTWLSTQVSESNGLVSVKSVFEHFGDDAPLKISKEAELLSSITERAGFGIAPDIWQHHAKPDANGKVVFFAGGHGKGFSPSQALSE